MKSIAYNLSKLSTHFIPKSIIIEVYNQTNKKSIDEIKKLNLHEIKYLKNESLIKNIRFGFGIGIISKIKNSYLGNM